MFFECDWHQQFCFCKPIILINYPNYLNNKLQNYKKYPTFAFKYKQKMKTLSHLLSSYRLTLICALAIFAASIYPIPETPLHKIPLADKWTHFLMYGFLSAVIWYEYTKCHSKASGIKLFSFAFVAPVCMGGIVELAQEYCTIGRHCDFIDFIANTIGVVIGNAIGLLIWYFARCRKASDANRNYKNGGRQ